MKIKQFKSRRGETYVDTGVKILTAVVCGALILGSVFWILKDTVLANVKTKVSDMLNGPDINPLEGVMWEPGVEKVPSTGDLWTMEGNTLTGYLGPKSAGMNLVIPNEVDGVRVIRIQNASAGNTADTRINIFGTIDEPTSMTIAISNGIKEIGNSAFSGCTGLSGQLNLPDSIREIGEMAFNKCTGLTGDLVLPDSAKNMGRAAFQYAGCSGTLTLPDGLTKIPEYAFNQSNLSGTLTLPSGLTSIGSYAFNKCKFTGNLTLPSGLTNIGRTAFQLCQFTGSLTIPNGLTTIEDYAFGSTTFDGTLTLPSGITRIGIAAFNKAPFIGSLTLPESLTEIGDAAFQFAKFTGPLTIPSNVVSLKQFAFNQCTGLTSLSLPEGLKTIDKCAFQYCAGMTNILTIPESVISLGDLAFNHCYGFKNTELKLPSGLTSFGTTHMFYNFATTTCASVSIDANNPNFKVVDNVLYSKDGSQLLYYPPMKSNASYTLPEGVTDMNELCFSRNQFLKTLTLPNSYIVRTSDFPASYLNTPWGNGLAVGLYVYTGVVNVEAKSDNPRYASVNGVLYSKDLKSLWYFPIARTGAIVIPDGTERLEYGSIMPKFATSLYIPSSVTYIDSTVFLGLKDDCPSLSITIDTNNPKYKVVDNKIVEK